MEGRAWTRVTFRVDGRVRVRTERHRVDVDADVALQQQDAEHMDHPHSQSQSLQGPQCGVDDCTIAAQYSARRATLPTWRTLVRICDAKQMSHQYQ